MMDGDGMARASKEEVFIAYAVSRGWAGCILGLNLENVLAVAVVELEARRVSLDRFTGMVSEALRVAQGG